MSLTPEEKKERTRLRRLSPRYQELNKIRQARYRKTEKRKLCVARYRATEKGKVTDRKHAIKANHSPQKKAYNKKFEQLPHVKARRKIYADRTKEQKYIYSLKRFYGMTPEEYYSLLKKQNGVCAICGLNPKTKLVVDHCHKTGTVRGIICRKCNSGLGMLGDTAEHLAKALRYLAK